MDVLEHVADDRELLAEYVARIPRRATVVITVPAFRFLWSGHDVFLGHERRYTLAEVEALVTSAGLEIATGAYYFACLLPIALARRLVRRAARHGEPRSDLTRHSAPVNLALNAVCRLELPLFRFFLYWTDGLIHFVFLLVNPNQRARQNAFRDLIAPPRFVLTEENIKNLRDEKDHYVVSLPMEIATGDGFRIGCDGDHEHEEVGISSSYLKREKSDRPVTHPQSSEWKRVVLSPEPDWVQFKGLWGVKSWIENESGPPRPKWDRPENLLTVKERMRWGKPLEWLKNLDSNKH